jgi:uncharacterized protein
MIAPTDTESTPRSRLLAPLWHTALVIAALAVNAYSGWLHSAKLRESTTVNRPALYLRTIIVEWLILALVLLGVRLHKSPLSIVLGERWRSASRILQDLGIAIAFLAVSVSAVSMLGPHGQQAGTDPAVRFLMPQTMNEKWLWVVVALSAGICEEAVYRGYLQHQFITFTRSLPAGILLSAVLFGASHAYQGFRPALLICLGGLMSGTLAWWRRSVRPGMIAHALQDFLAIVVSH